MSKGRVVEDGYRLLQERLGLALSAGEEFRAKSVKRGKTLYLTDLVRATLSADAAEFQMSESVFVELAFISGRDRVRSFLSPYSKMKGEGLLK